jgi:hypothetical protein
LSVKDALEPPVTVPTSATVPEVSLSSVRPMRYPEAVGSTPQVTVTNDPSVLGVAVKFEMPAGMAGATMFDAPDSPIALIAVT